MSNDPQKFKEVILSGDARRRGLIHGESLRQEIALARDYYDSIFKLSEQKIFELADFFSTRINDFNPDYSAEIEGIAEGANIDKRWITALNARTEILSAPYAVECTSLGLPESAVLAQNWDWGQPLEELTSVFRIEKPDDKVICMISEPGIIGKIGLNSDGIGVCLNILTIEKALRGLPIHIVLRAILDCSNQEEVRDLLQEHGGGKASNVMIGSHAGEYINMEFAVDNQYAFETDSTPLVHTNHYLGASINSPDEARFLSSYTRFARANELIEDLMVEEIPGIEICKTILSDKSNQNLPILRKYVPEEQVGHLGTVCTVIMDLENRMMYLRKGCNEQHPYHCYPAN